MLIRSVTVSDFAILQGPVRVRFAPGLNIVHGPNESGKSTLLEAIWSGLTLRSRVTGQRLDRIAPRGGGTPCVELVFEHGGRTYAVVKVFNGARGETRLIIDGGGEFTRLADEEAEAALRGALGLSERAGMSRSGNEHLGIWPLLWVRQGESSLPPAENLFDVGRRSLGDRLADLAGEVLAGGGSEKLFNATRAEYLRFFTERTGHDRSGADSLLGAGAKQAEEAQQRLDELTTLRQQYHEDVDRFVQLSENIELVERGLPERQRTLRALEEQAAQARTVVERLNAVRAELATAQARRDRAQERLEQRQQRERDLADAKKRAHDGDRNVEAFRKTLTEHESSREGRDNAVDGRRADVEVAAKRVQRLRLHAELSNCRSRLADLEGRLEARTEGRDRIENLEAQLAELPLTAAAHTELERLGRQHEQAVAVVHAASAAVRLTAKKALALKIGRKRIELAPNEDWSDRAEGRLKIQIDGIAEIEVIPGDVEVGNLRNQAADIEKTIRSKLRDYGLKSVGQARQIDEARRRFDAQLHDERRVLAIMTPEADADSNENLEALREQAAALGTKLAGLGVLEELDIPSDTRSLLALQADTERNLEQARLALEQAQAHLAAHGTERAHILGQIGAAEADKQSALEQARVLEARLSDESDESGAASLQASIDTENGHLTEHRQSVDAVEKELSALGGEDMVRGLVAARDELARVQDDLVEQKRERDQLEGRLTGANIIGLHDRVAAAQAELERAEATYAPVLRRSRAIRLLYETLDDCRNAARQSVLLPLRRATEPLVETVFGKTAVTYDQQFSVEKIRRFDVDDTFEQLSGGAREQLALLVRLGMARVLANGQPLTVMLDDVLMATDADRFQRMVKALLDVTDPLQILMFTCQWERYRSIGSDKINGIDLTEIKEAE